MSDPAKKKYDMVLIAVAAVIAAFFAFFGLKVSGHFDFTHNYGVRDITATIDPENVMLMIDGDMATTWNEPTFLGETKAHAKDRITILFDGERSISAVKMYGNIPNGLVIMTKDGTVVGAKEHITADGVFSFTEPVYTETLVIEAGQDKEVSWSISEIEITD